MVITPGIQDLPYTIVNGRKFFELTAEEILGSLWMALSSGRGAITVPPPALRFMFFQEIK